MWLPHVDEITTPTRDTVMDLTAKQIAGRVASAPSVWEALVWAWTGRVLWEHDSACRATVHDALATIVWTITPPPVAPAPVRELLRAMRDYYYMGACPRGPVVHGRRVVLGMLRGWGRRAVAAIADPAPTLRDVPGTAAQSKWFARFVIHTFEPLSAMPQAERLGAYSRMVIVLGHLHRCHPSRSEATQRLRRVVSERVDDYAKHDGCPVLVATMRRAFQ